MATKSRYGADRVEIKAVVIVGARPLIVRVVESWPLRLVL
jgi:hypothetical protein